MYPVHIVPQLETVKTLCAAGVMWYKRIDVIAQNNKLPQHLNNFNTIIMGINRK